MSKSRLLRTSLALSVVGLLAGCAVPYGPPYDGPGYDPPPPVVIYGPCGEFNPGCDHGHGRPPGPDHGRPTPNHGGRDGPGHVPGPVRPPAPRPAPPMPHPGHHDQEEQPVKR